MKKLKFGLSLFFAGQLAALFYKDKPFKDKFKEAKWLDKFKILFDWLLDLNKKLIKDVKEFDYEWKLDELNNMISCEKSEIEEKIEDMRIKLTTLNKEKIQPIIEEIEKKAKWFKKLIEEKIEDINDKYELQEKLNKVMKKIEEIKNWN